MYSIESDVVWPYYQTCNHQTIAILSNSTKIQKFISASFLNFQTVLCFSKYSPKVDVHSFCFSPMGKGYPT